MKVLGMVFSIVGNIGTFLAVLAAMFFSLFDMVMTCVFLGLSIVLFIIANIGNKIEDSIGEGLKVKIVLFRLLGWFPNLVGKIVGIAGPFVIIFAVIGFPEFLMLGIAMFIGGVVWMNLYGTYILHHCKYCGSNLKGGGYEYEEIERSAIFGNSDKVRLVSKIRFEFDCPECGESTVFFKKLNTNGEQIDKYARSIVGR